MNKLVKKIERKFKVKLNFKSDKEMFDDCKKSGVPSLAKLLKMTN